MIPGLCPGRWYCGRCSPCILGFNRCLKDGVVFRLQWKEPSGVQTAYIAPAKKALDWCIQLLGNGYRVEVWDNTGAKIAPADLVKRAGEV